MADNGPAGMVGILTDETGRVIAAEADFDGSGYGGFTLAQSQRVRLKRVVAFAMVNAYASPNLVRVMSSHEAEGLMEKLCRNHGYRLTWKSIGHGPEAEE